MVLPKCNKERVFIISSLTNYLETGSQDPCYNLAFEETVLARRTQGDYLLLWQNDNTIVIGQNQNAEAAQCITIWVI